MSPAYEWRQRNAYAACSQAAYADGMKINSPRHLRRHHWAHVILRLTGDNVTDMARQIETPRTHLSALLAGAKGIGDKLAAKIEAAYDKPAGWLDQEITGTLNFETHRAGEGTSTHQIPLAHAVSHLQPIVTPRTIVWEYLVKEPIEGQFLLAVRGDALMPTYPPGQMAIWQACDDKAASPGQAVLIKLPGDQFELRFLERRGGTWAGVSQRIGFGELQPERDQAVVVARLRYLDLG